MYSGLSERSVDRGFSSSVRPLCSNFLKQFSSFYSCLLSSEQFMYLLLFSVSLSVSNRYVLPCIWICSWILWILKHPAAKGSLFTSILLHSLQHNKRFSIFSKTDNSLKFGTLNISPCLRKPTLCIFSFTHFCPYFFFRFASLVKHTNI